MEWILPNQGNILSDIEGTTIEPIKIEINGSENYEITKISGNFPKGISLIKENDGYYLEGILDLVSESTEYYFTLQAKDLDTEEYIQRWFSIGVITKITYWDGSNPNNIEILEKTYFQQQFKLINPEGNEIFKKIGGELPNGLTLSETGLLYGVAEEDREEEYKFIIGIYRDNKEIDKSEVISLKIKDLSENTKPIWLTDEGILGYIDYGIKKDLQVIAYDFSGNDIYYELVSGYENNLPAGIYWTEESETTGKLYGICNTKIISDEWNITIRPYIKINNSKIYGDIRTFNIVTNAIEKDDLIEWITNEIDPVKIGYTYNFYLKAKAKNTISYELVSGELPNGLFLNKKGNIYGVVNYQDIKDYTFTVRAYTSVAFEQKTFTISVEKGLCENALNTYLYINKEYLESYDEMLLPFDISSAYNSYNPIYKIPFSPKINIATINGWDNILLKYKFEQFNTPIDIIMKETKKKSMEYYDFIYKNFNEVNKKSQVWDLKLHTDDETIMTTRFGEEFRPGYIREDVYGVPVIHYYTIGDVEVANTDDPASMEKIEQVTNEEGTKYYYITTDESGKEIKELLKDPVYTPTKECYNYAEFGQPYVNLRNGEEETKTYITKVSKGRYYEIDSLRMVNINEPVYIRKNEISDTTFFKYILKDNEEIEVKSLLLDGYASYDPSGNNKNQYWINPNSYDKINFDNTKSNYYYFGSPTTTFKTTSIEAIRNIFTEEFYVDQIEDKVWYKVGNQEIIYKNAETKELETFEENHYTIKYDKELDLYYIDDKGGVIYIDVYAKMNDNTMKKVFAKIGNEYKEIKQKIIKYEGDIIYIYYTVYPKNSDIPLTNALIELEWDDSIKLTCEKNDDIYEWFLIKQVENPYVYYADKNTSYGYDKDIILPNIIEDNITDGKVKFLDLNEEINYLPEYMIDLKYDFWKSFTDYKIDDKVIHGEYIYKCIFNHTSEEEFNENYWEQESNAKKYTPTIPLFFAKPNSHNAVLKNMNAYEKEGNYWYGRKFLFYEVHFEPKFKKNIDIFTIDFYNSINKNSPEFLLV